MAALNWWWFVLSVRFAQGWHDLHVGKEFRGMFWSTFKSLSNPVLLFFFFQENPNCQSPRSPRLDESHLCAFMWKEQLTASKHTASLSLPCVYHLAEPSVTWFLYALGCATWKGHLLQNKMLWFECHVSLLPLTYFSMFLMPVVSDVVYFLLCHNYKKN